jgi:hypothetical protein
MRVALLILIVGAFLLIGAEILTCLADDADMTKEWEKDIDESLKKYKE